MYKRHSDCLSNQFSSLAKWLKRWISDKHSGAVGSEDETWQSTLRFCGGVMWVLVGAPLRALNTAGHTKSQAGQVMADRGVS
jgi:hypothetical protein